MNRMFVRIYAAVAASLLLSFATMAVIVEFGVRDKVDEVVGSWATQPMSELARRIDQEQQKGASDADAIARARGDYSFNAHLLQLGALELDQEELSALEAGKAVSRRTPSERELMILMPNRAQVLLIGPVDLIRPATDPHILIGSIFCLGLIALGIYLVLRPVDQELKVIAGAARALGEGDLEHRVEVEGPAELQTLATTFNQMADRTQKIISSQRELLQAVSHELRTPLARLFLMVELTETADDAPMRQKHLESMERSLNELNVLVDELLTFTSLDESHVRSSPATVDLGELLDEAIAGARLPITFELERLPLPGGELVVEGDQRLLARMLANLLSNAARHSFSRGRLWVEAGERTVTFHVEDDGPGVPIEDRERIFEPFVRLDESRTRHTGGYGLGLAIARRITRRHGGELTITSSGELGGAHLIVTLPVLASATTPYSA